MKKCRKIIAAILELKYFVLGAAILVTFIAALPAFSQNSSGSERSRYLNLYDSGLSNVQTKLAKLETVAGTRVTNNTKALKGIDKIMKTLFGVCSFTGIPAGSSIAPFGCLNYVKQQRADITRLIRAKNRTAAYNKVKETLEYVSGKITDIKTQFQAVN